MMMCRKKYGLEVILSYVSLLSFDFCCMDQMEIKGEWGFVTK